MKLSIFTTATDPINRGDLFSQATTCYEELADEVVITGEDWPKEFKWSYIGEQFQKGYEACTGDWVIHADLDFIFHEQDYERIREVLENTDSPGVAFWKYQIFTPERYNVKSTLVIAVNKRRFGDRIRFDGGGDLCQPTLDGEYLDPHQVKQAKIPIWNYESTLKTKEQILEDKGRFARAWQREFGSYKLGGPDDASAYEAWWRMIEGRYSRHKETLPLDAHPLIMQETLTNLRPDQFGFNAFGLKDIR